MDILRRSWIAFVLLSGLGSSGCFCTVQGSVCGDGYCDADEDQFSCSADCAPAPYCGDGYCDPGEDGVNCAADCGGGPFCGDGTCDATEDTTCTDCTFEIGESLTTDITQGDYLTSDLSAAFGITEADVLGAFYVAKPMNVYDFSGFGTRWIAGYFNNTGLITVRASGARDWLMLCEAPDGVTLFANDDFDTAACTMMGICDPGLNLMGAGIWLCIFGAAPFPQNPDPYGSITITASAM
jgi:hypothetical protein